MKLVSKPFLQSIRISQIIINTLIIVLEVALVASLHRVDYGLNNDGLNIGLIHVFRISISVLSFAFIAFSFRRFSHRWNTGQIKKDIYTDAFLALAWTLSSISNTVPLFYGEDKICGIYQNQDVCNKMDTLLIFFSWFMIILLMVSALITTKRWRRYKSMILKLHNPNSSAINNNNVKTITMNDSGNNGVKDAYNVTTSSKSPIGSGSGFGNGILATASLTSPSSSPTTNSSPSTPNSKVVMQEGVLENGQPVLFFHQNNLHMFSQKNISTTTLNNNNNNNNNKDKK